NYIGHTGECTSSIPSRGLCYKIRISSLPRTAIMKTQINKRSEIVNCIPLVFVIGSHSNFGNIVLTAVDVDRLQSGMPSITHHGNILQDLCVVVLVQVYKVPTKQRGTKDTTSRYPLTVLYLLRRSTCCVLVEARLLLRK